MPTYAICAVTRDNMGLVGDTATWKNDYDIYGQFKWCANGGENGDTRCTALFDEQSKLYVGFFWLSLAVEYLQTDMNVVVSVEFVYLHAAIRGFALSHHFISCAMENFAQWLHANMRILKGRRVTLYSASNPKSDAGLHFLARLEEQLRQEANARHWSFTSSINNDD